MHVLIIKTSSMGDVIHALPALVDAKRALPNILVDWVVEESFAGLLHSHPLINKVIPVAFRRWRKKIMSRQTLQEWQAFRRTIRATRYDLIIDAQGLLKSVLLMLHARGTRCGFDFNSSREAFAAFFYHRKFFVAKKQHAIERIRSLFSQALGYTCPLTQAEYGIHREHFCEETSIQPYVVFLHGTTWSTKHWPEERWSALANIANQQGFLIKLPWGSTAEQERAQRIAASCTNAEVLQKMDLTGMTQILAGSKGVISVDTGLGHLAAALNVPTISLYGPTNPLLTGTQGQLQQHLSSQFPCAPCLSRTCLYDDNIAHRSSLSPLPSSLYPVKPPCFTELSPTVVWAAFSRLL